MSEYFFINKADMAALQSWHSLLDENRGERARLRRAERAEDVLLTDAFHHFLKKMTEKWRDENHIFSAAAVAGLLSHVRENCQKASRQQYQPEKVKRSEKKASFAEQLATPADGNKKAPMSESRFYQLQKSRTTDEFYRNIRRAIQLLNGRVNLFSLADDIIHWHSVVSG
jgi:CRISPR system Cascade subunit CasB